MPDSVIVNISDGLVRGRQGDGVISFLGIPYGRALRFQAPTPVVPWTGIRQAFEFGPPSPQVGGGMFTDQLPPLEMRRLGLGERSRQAPSEDCLTLNVWTPAIDSARRPVLVWFHGGAYTSWSSGHELWDFRNLARRGDVVAVSVNHRLGPLGYLHLAGIDGKHFPDAGNAGTLDLIAALGWVQRNAEAVGGDPGNVTIFGQSGGAHKVASLLGMPAANGLFHRAIMISPPGGEARMPTEALKFARQLLGVLGLSESSLCELVSMPVEQVIDGANELLRRGATDDPIEAFLAWWPTVDGRNLLAHPQEAVARGASATVPLLIGTTTSERRGEALNDVANSGSEAWLRARVLARNSKIADLLPRYRELHPDESAHALLLIILGHHDFWIPTIRFSEAKLAGGAAPVFVYLFAKGDPSLGPGNIAPHNWDMPFLFNNVDRVPAAAAIPDAARLARQASGALVSFAHTGDPGWPRYTLAERATMVFDDDSRVELDPAAEERRLWNGVHHVGLID